MGAHFEALDEGVLLVPLDPRYTQVGFNLVSIQVCKICNQWPCIIWWLSGWGIARNNFYVQGKLGLHYGFVCFRLFGEFKAQNSFIRRNHSAEPLRWATLDLVWFAFLESAWTHGGCGILLDVHWWPGMLWICWITFTNVLCPQNLPQDWEKSTKSHFIAPNL